MSQIHPKNSGIYNAAREKEENILGKRIAEARTAGKLSLAAMSRLLETCGISVSPQAIFKWETGRTTPNAYQLLAVAHLLGMDTGLSDFTSTGSSLNAEGLRKLQEYRMDLIATGKYRPQPARKSGSVRYIDMRVSSLPVSAGTGAFLDDDMFELVSFPEPSVPDGAEFGIRISGDSMEPVYHDGQIVWIQTCTDLRIGEVGIFVYDGSGYIKAYDEQEPDPSSVDAFVSSDGTVRMQPVMISYNEQYPPIPVSPEYAFSIIGRVLKA